jgi:hypothetical protein
MIELKRCNYITGDSSSVGYGVSQIVKFLELIGRNIILLSAPKTTSSTNLKYIINNKIEFKDKNNFKSIFKDGGKLFRVDLIIADLWHLRLSSIIEYKKILDSSGIDYIIIAREYHYKKSDIITDYHIKKESSSPLFGNDVDYIITDKVSGWSSNLKSLIKSYIRDKKIDGIID